MFFTRIGYVVAILAMILGVWKFVGGVIVASFLAPDDVKVALARYFGSYASTGALINAGTYTIIFSIALGILVEIHYAVRDKT